MDVTVLGSGGCTIIPKPLCQCGVCREAREKGPPYARTGPAIFIHDENLLIDTPAEIAWQLNRANIGRLDYCLFTHLDPDHVEGLRVVEQIALDFRNWRGYPDRQITVLLPKPLDREIARLCSRYGPFLEFYLNQGYVRCVPFDARITIGETDILGIPVERGNQTAFVYVIRRAGGKLVYAPCDIRPFPEQHPEIMNADLLMIQPGIFETGLKHGFVYPQDHISRTTLYTFGQTLELGQRIRAKEILFVHLEEYWNRGYDDYGSIERQHNGIRFAHDGMRITI